MKLNLKSIAAILTVALLINACTKEESVSPSQMKIETYIPTAELNIVEEVENFKIQVESNDKNYRQQNRQINAGKAMWLMEALGNYQYNKNAKYKRDSLKLVLDLEASFEVNYDENRQVTVGFREIVAEMGKLNSIIQRRTKSLNRLPRLIDYEVASFEDGLLTFDIKVILVENVLRVSYQADDVDENPNEFGPRCPSNGIRRLKNYCAKAQNLGYLYTGGNARPNEYVEACIDCLETNYGQYFLTNVTYASSHGTDNSNYANCYDDGTYNEYAMNGIFHGPNYVTSYNQYGYAAINYWNNDICSSNIIYPDGYPIATGTGLPTADYIRETYTEIGSNAYWCIKGIYVGLSFVYSDI